MNRESIKRDIAIIGISCKFSNSENPSEFWKNLKEGNEMIQFYSDEELLGFGVDKNTINNPNYVKRKTSIENSDSFDYPFFSYTKDEANLMDPQIRLLHEQVWSALEDAGYNVTTYTEKVGMYMTAEDNFNWIAHSIISKNKNVDPFYLSLINNKNFISSLISYNLNLKGPSMVVDTACSSSLTTVHLASRSLLLRECSIAIAGGVNLNTRRTKGHFYQEGMIGSKDGYCRAFDSESTGTTGAEGTGVVVLKRLEEAIKDRDNIYAVIRSSAVNNDGKRKVGFTAPSVKGQAECIRMAHKMANVPYNTISYIEAHGTGTKLGDPIEIEALNQAFNYDTSHSCAVGSLKANIGHLGNAAGIGGLIKTTLSLKNRIIPPLLHYKKPNPEINFDGGPFFANPELKKWESDNSLPLRAGVSSFGIGGTNVHAILEEFKKAEPNNHSRPYQLISYSAKSQNAVSNYTTKLKKFVTNEVFQLADLAYTLKVGRTDFLYKNFTVAKDKDELLSNLENKKEQFLIEKEKRDLVFMFSGQGTQYYKMAEDLYKYESDFKFYMDQGFKILFDITGQDYSEIIGYKPNNILDPNLINETQYTQPILFLVEYALASVLLKWGIKPKNMIGHSLGEYAAACIAEVFSLEDALKLIVKRSQLMSEVEKGSMAAIDAPIDEIIEFLNNNLSIAAINSESSCVVSGNKKDIEDFTQTLSLNEISFSVLKTSHAFHSNMMDSILEKYEKEFKHIKLSNPKMPFISNLTGKQILDEEATSSKYWIRHLRETVNFKDGIDFILQKSNAIFIEIGPGKTLLTLSKQNQRYSNKNVAIELVRRFNESIDDNQKFTNAIGQIWNQGIKVDWNEYYSLEERYRISAPTYCFDNFKLDFIVEPFSKLASNENSNDIKPFNEWFYIPNWKKCFLSKNKENKEQQQYLIFSDGKPLITALIKQLRTEGNKIIEVKNASTFEIISDQLITVNPFNDDDYLELFKQFTANNIQIDQIIFNWSFENTDQKTLQSVFSIFNNICSSLIDYSPGRSKKITLLTNLNHEILGDEESNVTMAASMKQLYVFAQENPNIFSCSIDVSQDKDDVGLVFKVIDDLKYNYSDTTIAFRNQNRWVEFYENFNLIEKDNSSYLKENKTYLITGGLGKVGKALALHLCDTYHSKVILTGRTIIPSEEFWDTVLADKEANPKLINAIEDLKVLKEKNRPVFYYSGDVSDFNSFSRVIENIEETHGNISGIIHAAGNIDNATFKPVENLNSDIVLQQFLPKVQGTINLDIIFKNKPLDFVWVTSSLASVLGGLTFGAYSVANAFIDSFINNKRKELQNWFCINLDGLVEDRINHQKLIEVFENTFSIGNNPQVILSVKDPNSFKLRNDLDIKPEDLSDNDRVIDRNSLSVEYFEPETLIEEELCTMVQSFFGYKKIGVLDNFFEIGGDSLKAMTMIKRINKLFGIEISIQDFYSNPSIRELSNEIELAIKIVNLQEKIEGENSIII
ncbi:type I polyketide synthase [Flavobacterium chilense]|uniref:Acyl transferase domain-containing protein n=1 Tax=Flavobacterium chilense TaxID=946677 RepID=A0A1M6XDA1_9FLAO|nr:type I polyketide synthase [Flavobacterium chilense]SHL03990.1 Acyl transferase domain-containing protein [Flavobacterium chilense]